MPRGRVKGFHHSEDTKKKMRGKRKEKKEEEISDEEILNEPIEVPAM